MITDTAKLAPTATAAKPALAPKTPRRMARPAAVASTPPREPGLPEDTAGPNNVLTTHASPEPTPAPRVTKSATVIAFLQREQGATLPELIAATSWLPHTTRAALTGIRKKGHVVEKTKRGDTTCYRIAAAIA